MAKKLFIVNSVMKRTSNYKEHLLMKRKVAQYESFKNSKSYHLS
jgi:hypothetical protein